MSQELYETVQVIIQDDACIKFYKVKGSLYLDVSGVGSVAGCLQASSGLWFLSDKAPDNTALCPITFSGKNLTELKQGTAT